MTQTHKKKGPKGPRKYMTVSCKETEYKSWSSSILRCNRKDYRDYGGRGISVCERWVNGEGNKSGYECFVEDMGKKPSPNHSLDRIDCNGNYEPSNCRWATPVEQQRNKRNNLLISAFGVKKTMADWIDTTGIKRTTINGRLARGWTVEKVLSTPPNIKKRNSNAKP